MIRLTVATVLCAMAALPGLAAGGVVLVRMEDKTIVPAAAGGQVTLDVTFQESPGPNQMEDLIGYDLGFLLEKVGGGPGGLRFAPPYVEKPEPFVFPRGPQRFEVYDFGPPGSGVLMEAFGPNERRIDITRDPVNAARLVLEYDPGTAPAEYRVRLDTDFSVLASGPDGPEFSVPTDLSDVGVIRLVPEPASLTIVAGYALLALRRRPKR